MSLESIEVLINIKKCYERKKDLIKYNIFFMKKN